jgi:hypothetical protein
VLKEFAVDPRVISSSFETCRYLISQFGADKGRLISKFPKTWKRIAIAAAENLPDGLNKERVIEYLSDINDEWLTMIRSGRDYQVSEDWLANAINAHQSQPFQAILCNQDNQKIQLIDGYSCDERHPLFAAPRTQAIKRKAKDLARTAVLMLENCRVLKLVDPYFAPDKSKWRDSLKEILVLIPDISRVTCEYHLLEKDNSPSTEQFKTDLHRLAGVIPMGGSLRVIRWKEKPGGERFHKRYVLTENAGLSFEGGLDPEFHADQTTDVGLLDRHLHALRWAEYDLDSNTFDLAHSVLIVDSNGNVGQLKT